MQRALAVSQDRRSVRFCDVDSTPDPKSSIDYLDIVAALDGVKRRKQISYELLHLQSGHHILDVGCGNGDDVCALALLVGAQGRVVGIDTSAPLIAKAQQRTENTSLPVEFHVGNVTHLAFADSTFDGCCVSRVFMHLTDRERALSEMIRVNRSGAWIVVAEPDWETLLIDAPDQSLMRAFVAHYGEQIQHNWCGRQLPRLFKDAGLEQVTCVPHTTIIEDYPVANTLFRLHEFMEVLVTTGQASRDAVAAWVDHVEQASQHDRFFCSLTVFIVAGRKL
jgi:ubiquinone/menaquinone biosynthesis C-methylase UbiE